MKVFVISIGLIMGSLQTDYRSIFTFDYTRAKKFMYANKEIFLHTCNSYELNPEIISSVLFPEFIRYSIFSNYMETKFLEHIYVKYGKENADFSVGPCQMKPSFIEALEENIKQSKHLSEKYHRLIEYKSNSVFKIRKERIKRINDLKWQLMYACCFYEITGQLHKNTLQKLSGEDSVRFLASAYNHGFDKPADEILWWQEVPVFPYGLNSLSRQYKYSDISVYFYRNVFREIFETESRNK